MSRPDSSKVNPSPLRLTVLSRKSRVSSALRMDSSTDWRISLISFLMAMFWRYTESTLPSERFATIFWGENSTNPRMAQARRTTITITLVREIL